jgi:hypothetical protein
MNRTLPLVLLAGGALLSASAGIAATTPPAKTVVAQHKTATRVTKTSRTTTTAKPRMVTAKLANGKTVTYNCALAGNATKQACK